MGNILDTQMLSRVKGSLLQDSRAGQSIKGCSYDGIEGGAAASLDQPLVSEC